MTINSFVITRAHKKHQKLKTYDIQEENEPSVSFQGDIENKSKLEKKSSKKGKLDSQITDDMR